MLKFRGSKYQDPFDFEKDVRQLFEDYKGFFKDPNSQVLTTRASSRTRTHRYQYVLTDSYRRPLYVVSSG